MLMADGEYIGHLPFRVVAEDCALRVLVPPAVAAVRWIPDRKCSTPLPEMVAIP